MKKLLERIKKRVETEFPGIPVTINDSPVWILHDAVRKFLQCDAPPTLDEYTLLWSIQQLCLSGKTCEEALKLLQIKYKRADDL